MPTSTSKSRRSDNRLPGAREIQPDLVCVATRSSPGPFGKQMETVTGEKSSRGSSPSESWIPKLGGTSLGCILAC